jgi:hypothetical protein
MAELIAGHEQNKSFMDDFFVHVTYGLRYYALEKSETIASYV